MPASRNKPSIPSIALDDARVGMQRWKKSYRNLLLFRELEQQDVCRDDACNIISWTAGQRGRWPPARGRRQSTRKSEQVQDEVPMIKTRGTFEVRQQKPKWRAG